MNAYDGEIQVLLRYWRCSTRSSAPSARRSRGRQKFTFGGSCRRTHWWVEKDGSDNRSNGRRTPQLRGNGRGRGRGSPAIVDSSRSCQITSGGGGEQMGNNRIGMESLVRAQGSELAQLDEGQFQPVIQIRGAGSGDRPGGRRHGRVIQLGSLERSRTTGRRSQHCRRRVSARAKY